MTLRQKILKLGYPLLMAFRKRKAIVLINEQLVRPPVSFYKLSVELNNGTFQVFEDFRHKKVLLVNTASDCGYTAQYRQLQKLQEQFKDRLVVIAFPSNDFRQQEKGSDAEIATFCEVNFGIRFPLVKKSSVVGKEQHPVFQWLSRKELNGWNAQSPRWNFSKYLVNEEGVLTHYFDPYISPLSEEVMKAVAQPTTVAYRKQ